MAKKGKDEAPDGKGKGAKGKGGKGKEKAPKRQRSGVRPLRLGLLVAAVVAGPPLYRLVQQGSLDSTAALEKAGIVALGCAIGLSWLRGLIVDYQAEVELERRRREARTQEILRMIEAENAAKAEQAAAEAARQAAEAQKQRRLSGA